MTLEQMLAMTLNTSTKPFGYKNLTITRVPNGWIYTCDDSSGLASVFVPEPPITYAVSCWTTEEESK